MQTLFLRNQQIRWNGIFFLVLRISLLLILFTGCTQKQKETDINIELSEQQAAYFSGYTNRIKSNQPVILRFAEKLPYAAGTKIDSAGIIFSPKIECNFYVKNDYEIEIVPVREIFPRSNYQMTIDIGAIYNVELEPLILPVEIKKRELTKLETNFESHDKLRKFVAAFSFNENDLNANLIEKGISVKYGNRNLFFRITKDSFSPNVWILESEEFAPGNDTSIVLGFAKDVLLLEEDIERSFMIPDSQDLLLTGSYYEKVGDAFVIVLSFSENLDFQQDVSSFIEVKNLETFQLAKMENRIHIEGDFQTSQIYQITVKKGIQSAQGLTLQNEKTQEIHIKNELANLMFTDQGNMLTSLGNNKIRFRSVNVKQARLTVKKVYESNLGFFLHDMTFSNNNRHYWNINRVGVQVHQSTIKIESPVNQWVESEIDLNKLLDHDKSGLYIIELNYNRSDCIGENSNSGNLSKNIIISDLAITLKQGKESVVIATDLTLNKPVANATIKIFNYQNQMFMKGQTNSQGMFHFTLDGNIKDYDYDFYETDENVTNSLHYIIAESKDSRALLNYREMQWNMSTFDVKGYDNPESGSAYIYTERGVYRPGDAINFTIILRNNQHTFPEKQPVLITIYDPTMTKLTTTTLTSGKDGVFSYAYTSDENCKTGNWQLHYETGGIKGMTNFKIETVVAERLKVTIEPEFANMNHNQMENKIKLNAMYLFGAAASRLTAKLTASFEPKSKQFKAFPKFVFYNQTIQFSQPKITILSAATDEEGNIEQVWKRPDFANAPCEIMAELQAEVIDKGGRASKATEFITIEPFQYYVGLKLSDKMISYQQGSFEVVLVDTNGKPVVGEQLEVKVYQNDRYWWWEYNWEGNHSRSFKQSRDSKMAFSQNITSENKPIQINMGKIYYGKYLVEVSHKATNGHVASQFFYPRWWGETQGGIMDIGVMQLRSDKPEYAAGDEVKIQFDAPENCRVLISLEDGEKIRKIRWEEPKVTDGKATITLKTDESMIPNMYCSISVLQKVANSNDLPIRSYGTIPIKVIDKKTVNNVSIKTSETFKPNSVFQVKIQTEQKRKSQITVAVVDEGLLSLTNFRSPNPWEHFFRKRLLKIKSFDTYGFVMGISKGDVFKSFSVGGDSYDMESLGAAAEKRKEITDLLQKTVKRFEPVCLYSGVLETDENGFLATEFTMPHYIGAVRIMAVSVIGNAYGFGEKTVPVKDKIMVQPSLPRFASPGDEFVIPVEVFVDDKEIKEVKLTVKSEGSIAIQGEKIQTLTFAKPGSQMINLRAQALMEIGYAKLNFTVTSGNEKNEQQINLPVYPSQPSVYQGETKILAKGGEIEFQIPTDAYKGSMTADFQIAKLTKLNLSERMNWLIRYPYGCVEQVTSAVFPQLFLKELVINENLPAIEIDKNINAGIKKLRDYQAPNGGLSYWPGNRSVTNWGTNYVLHFLLEAKKQGYNVSPDFLNGLIAWLERKTTTSIPKEMHEFADQAYGLYLLALAEKPNLQGMNILYESYLDKLPTTYQWLLSATYRMVGKNDIAGSIESKITQVSYSAKETRHYHRFTWGSDLRDEALLLLSYNALDKKKEAFTMFNHIADKISGTKWYSTQTLSFCLTALGDYYRNHKNEFDTGIVKGELVFQNGKKQPFSSEKIAFQLPLHNQFGEIVKVKLDKSAEQENVFVTMNWTGIPVIDFLPKEFNGLSLRTEFLTESNQHINPEKIKQGDVIQMRITVKNIADRGIDNIALVQYLPAGWEIENERLNPSFSMNQTKPEHDYLDMRDDKIMWFFDLPKSNVSKIFTFKIRAVTRGKFKLPSTYCEAMYHHDINATLQGRTIEVIEAK